MGGGVGFGACAMLHGVHMGCNVIKCGITQKLNFTARFAKLEPPLTSTLTAINVIF